MYASRTHWSAWMPSIHRLGITTLAFAAFGTAFGAVRPGSPIGDHIRATVEQIAQALQ